VKRVCTYCERVSLDGNLWCQERDCPAGAMPIVFDYGEWLGDSDIVRLLRVLRTSAIYEARRGKTMVLLKVAHNGCQDQLKREAITLAQLAHEQHPMLPVPLPAYEQAEINQRPYGKTVFQDEIKYYEVFKHAKGEFLRDMLLKNPQPWYQHAAWLTISLADAIAYLNIKANRLHLNFNPDVIFVRIDKQGIPRPLLLDLGMLSEPQAVDIAWVQQYGLPAYTPPEIISRDGAASYAADVYGLGLVLYEMLAGHPAFSFKLQRDEDVRQAVLKTTPAPLNRTDLSEDIHQIVHQAIDKVPERRQQDVRVFAKMLRTKFGEVPVEKKGLPIRRGVAVLILLAILIFVLLMILSAFWG
jgi:serine/threonine protein kinase